VDAFPQNPPCVFFAPSSDLNKKTKSDSPRRKTLRGGDLNPANPVKDSNIFAPVLSKDRPQPLEAGHWIFGIVERLQWNLILLRRKTRSTPAKRFTALPQKNQVFQK
jgi:hypothetical protein